MFIPSATTHTRDRFLGLTLEGLNVLGEVVGIVAHVDDLVEEVGLLQVALVFIGGYSAEAL